LAEKWVKTIEHGGLYFEYWITFILYVLANKSFHFETDIIYGTPSVHLGNSRYFHLQVKRLWNKIYTVGPLWSAASNHGL
jgi:hypothetical protein